MRNGNSIPLFDSRKDGYGSLDEEESQFDCTHPFLPLAVCPKCQSSEFQLHFDFEYPELEKLCGKRRFTIAHECAHQILY